MKIMKRKCSRCKKEKPIADFGRGKTRKDGLATWCKDCHNKYSRKYYQVLRIKVLEHYGGTPPKCACCGESHIEFLVIDHIEGGGTNHRSRMKNQSIGLWLRTNSYPKGYRVLCHNCNSAFGFFGYCPHQKGE